jgi:uncharacterized damage-inducible protein DinB
MHPWVIPLREILQLNTALFDHCLEGVDDALARKKVDAKTNSMLFIAVHLLDARFYMAESLGLAVNDPLKDRFQEFQNEADLLRTPPHLVQILEAWKVIAPHLERRFGELTERELKLELPGKFPVDDPTLLGGMAFLAQHESYHIGQLAILRRLHGLEAMRYQR